MAPKLSVEDDIFCHLTNARDPLRCTKNNKQ